MRSDCGGCNNKVPPAVALYLTYEKIAISCCVVGVGWWKSLEHVFTNCAHLQTKIFARSSSQNSSSSVQLNGELLLTYKSFLWKDKLGNSSLCPSFNLNLCMVALTVPGCYPAGTLAHVSIILATLTDFSSRIPLKWATWTLTTVPVPDVEKHHMVRILPPASFTVKTLCSRFKAMCSFHGTLVSSELRISS